MREISIPLSLNEEMKAGHYDAQIKSKLLPVLWIWTTWCAVRDQRGDPAAMRGMSIGNLNLMHGSAKKLRDIRVCVSCTSQV